jgi:hypothetical protein
VIEIVDREKVKGKLALKVYQLCKKWKIKVKKIRDE